MATNLVNFVNTHNYDGVDLDWEAGDFNNFIDQNAYINLIMALRDRLGTAKTISMSVYWQIGLVTVAQRNVANLDQVNVLCYDMDQFNSDTYFNSATYSAPGDSSHNSCAVMTSNVGSSIPAAKIGVGIPFYGRIWTGCVDFLCSDGLHDPLQVWWGTPTQHSLHYNDMVNGPYWTLPHHWDADRAASFISVDDGGPSNEHFISYTDEQQIASFVQLMLARGYGGIMEYELEYDFLPAQSGDARHPLAAAVYSSIVGSQQAQPPRPPNERKRRIPRR